MISSRVLFILGLLCATSAEMQARIPTHPDSGVIIDVKEVFEKIPPGGGHPMQIQISNQSRNDGVWQATFQSPAWGKGLQSKFEFRVPRGGTRNFEIVIPLLHGLDSTGHRSDIQMQFFGPGVSNYSINVGSPNHLNNETNKGFILLGSTTRTAWTDLGDSDIGASLVLPTLFPVDPRAYFGVDSIWLDTEEISALRPEQTESILGWVARGGRLYLTGDPALFPNSRLPKTAQPQEEETWHYGMGSIYRVQAEPKVLVQQIKSVRSDPVNFFGDGARKGETPLLLRNSVEQGSGPGISLIVFTLAFAILVGPVNLFLFAGKSRRHRLFKEVTGESCSDYIMDRRLEIARSKLQTDPTLSIKEVAYASGFASPAHFSAKFKTHFGVTPTGYR